MTNKWKIYTICLLSYSTIHAIRTLWSAIKTDLKNPPFNFSVKYLGALDMLVLFVLALGMNCAGSKIESWGSKRTIITSMIALALMTSLIGLFLNLDLTSGFLYIVFFSIGIGLLSSVGWPSCLCVKISIARWSLAILGNEMESLYQLIMEHHNLGIS